MKRTIAILSLFLAASLSALSMPRSEKTAQRFRENISFSHALVGYIYGAQTSKEELLKLAEGGSENAVVYYYLGQIFQAENNLPQAAKYFAKAHEIDPDNYWYESLYVYANMDSCSDEEGLEALEHLAAKKDELRTTVDILVLKIRLGRVAEATAALDSLIGIGYPLNAVAFNYLSRAAVAIDNDTLAVDLLGRSLAEEPDGVYANYTLSEIYRERKDYPKFSETAQGFFRSKAIPLEAKRQYYTELVSVPREILKKNIPVYDTLTTAFLQTHPTDTSALKTAGQYYTVTDRLDIAKSVFALNASINASDPQWAYYHVSFLRYAQSYSEEVEYCLLYYKRYKDPAFKWEAVQVYNELGEHKKAIELVKEMLDDSTDKLEKAALMTIIGDFYQHIDGLDNIAKCYYWYEKSLKANPKSAMAYNNYAYFRALKKDNLKYALRMSKKACALEKENATYLDTLGYIYYLLGDYKTAKEVFIKCLSYGGRSEAVIVEHYADVLNALGEKTADYYYKLSQKLLQEGK